MDDSNNNSLSQLAMLRALQTQNSPQAIDEYAKANPTEFHSIVSNSAEKNPMIKANVTPYSPEDYSKFQTFLSGDKKSGYAIKPAAMTEAGADELISVFSNEKGRGKDILKHAVDVGGAKQLDAFDINNKLPSLYGKEFKETSRFKFDPQYAPQDWDYEKLGTPDVIGMKLDNSPAKAVTRGLRQAGTAALKYGLPAAVLAGASGSDSIDDAIADTLIPGGVDSLGDSLEDRMMQTEVKALQNYAKSPAGQNSMSRQPALENQGLREEALRKLMKK